MKWCVIVPAYQACASLEAVLDELVRELPQLASREALLVVDDGSTDGTADVARAFGATVLVHPQNRGKGRALLTGLAEARARGFEAALTVDADGQHPGASARVLLEASDDPGALVLGVRDLAGAGAPRANRFSNGISNFFLSRFAGRSLGDTQCGLRRYPVERTLELAPRAAGYAFEAEVILLAVGAGVPVLQVPVAVRYPPEDERVSHFDPVRDPARIIAVVLRTVFANVQR